MGSSNPKFHDGTTQISFVRANRVREIRSPTAARQIAEVAHRQLDREALGLPLAATDEPSSVAELEARLLDGTYVVVVEEPHARRLDPPRATPLSDLIDRPDPTTPPALQRSWLEFRVLNETGGRYPKASMVAELADGMEIDVELDNESRARLDDIPRGHTRLRTAGLTLSETEYRKPSVSNVNPATAAALIRPERAASFSLPTGKVHEVVVRRPDPCQSIVFDGTSFAPDSAFPTHGLSSMLGYATEHAAEFPRASYILFGHSDSSGPVEHNKKLSDRRAEVVLALMTADLQLFETVAEREAWGAREYQVMLRTIGNNPGAIDGEIGPLTRRAIVSFRNEYGRDQHHNNSIRDRAYAPLPEGDQLDEPTKLALRDAYHAQPRTRHCSWKNSTTNCIAAVTYWPSRIALWSLRATTGCP